MTGPTVGLSDDRLEELMVESYPDLLRLAVLILRDRAEAEDATQVALERAWRFRSQVHSSASAFPWLRRILVREAVRVRSSPWRGLRSPRRFTEDEPIGELSNSPDHVARLDIFRAFQLLSIEQQVAVVLHHYFDYPIADVAVMVGAPTETVRSRLRLAMRRLREELRDA